MPLGMPRSVETFRPAVPHAVGMRPKHCEVGRIPTECVDGVW